MTRAGIQMKGGRIEPAGVRRILVRAPNWLGDLMMITPALRAIRGRFPGATLVVLARGMVAEACSGQPGVDRVIRYDPRGEHRTLAARWALLRALRRERFDLALLFPRSFGSALWALACGVRRRLGHRGDGRAWMLTHRLPAVDTRAPRHHVELFFDLARALGVEAEPGPLRYDVSAEDRAAARSILLEARAGASHPRLTIHPGVSKAPRGWHVDRWRTLAQRVSLSWGGEVVVLGGSSEIRVAGAIAAAAGDRGLSLAGRVSLGVSAAIMEASDLVVANDSGAMHLAVALGVPVVAIFGPGSPQVTGPWTDARRHEVLTHRFPCSPCRQHFFHECDPAPGGKPYCIETVSLEEVWGACQRLRLRLSS
ncbi:MAG: lipopolysaccharide heptosyltransferase II [Acidobacteriota bacterium]